MVSRSHHSDRSGSVKKCGGTPGSRRTRVKPDFSDDTSHFLLPGDHVQQVHALAGWYADLQVPLPAQVDSSLPPCRALTWPPGLELRYLLPSAAAPAAELYAITEQVQQQTSHCRNTVTQNFAHPLSLPSFPSRVTRCSSPDRHGLAKKCHYGQ